VTTDRDGEGHCGALLATVFTFHEQTVGLQQRERVLDGRSDPTPEGGDQLVDGPRAVEQGKQIRKERFDGATLERDESATVLQEASTAVAHDATPRVQPRALGKQGG
jgi:hypothetical protein